MKRVFGIFEVAFDAIYLIIASVLGIILLLTAYSNNTRMLAGIMALVLAFGDAFHLLPRMKVVLIGNEEDLCVALGRGKQIASITMSIFYLILWNIGLTLFSEKPQSTWIYLVYLLIAIRVIICLFPQNKWQERYPPVNWGIYRNIPFFLIGIVISVFFFVHRATVLGLSNMWLAIILSFAFYLPVVLWSNKNPKIGMLMLPKTCTYLWMLAMCLSL